MLSDEDLRQISQQIRDENALKMKIFAPLAAFTVVLLVVMGIISMKHTGGSDSGILWFMLAAGAVISVLLYICLFGILRFQFNSLVRKHYPELAEELRV